MNWETSVVRIEHSPEPEKLQEQVNEYLEAYRSFGWRAVSASDSFESRGTYILFERQVRNEEVSH